MLPAFLIYTEDLKAFKGVVSKEDFADAIWAISEYTETGEEAEGLSPMATVLFRTIKTKVDRENEKYEKKCEAGKNGGRPKTEGNQDEPAKTNGNQRKPNGTNGNQTKPVKTNGKQKNQTETETETESSSTTGGNAGAGTREETPFGPVNVDPLIVKVQRELLGMTDTHYDLLAQYREEIGDEMISYAIDQAVANGARKWAYVESVLLRLKSAGIRTVAEAKAADEKRKTGSRDAPKAPKQVHAQQFTQRSYTDEQLEGGVDPLLAEAMAKVRAEKARSSA